MDIDGDGNIFITGRTASNDFPAKGAWRPAGADGLDGFIARIDPSKAGAASLIYSSYVGGNADDYSYGLAVDGASNAYITGVTSSPAVYSFPTTATIGANGSTTGIFVTKFSPQPTQRVHIPLVRRSKRGLIERAPFCLHGQKSATL